MKVFALLITGIWIGMLLGISFVEAPLKFRAPNITLTLGLGIGKLVFTALNKFEIFFSIVLSLWLLKNFKSFDFSPSLALGIVIVIVLLQSLWILPILNERADKIIQNVSVSSSNYHLYYIIMEVLKLGFLLFGFFKIYEYPEH